MFNYIIKPLITYTQYIAKILFVNFGLMLCIVEAQAVSVSANSNKTKAIQGYSPYMHSIAAMLDLDKNPTFHANGAPILTPGSIVYIPSDICNIPTISLDIGVIPLDKRLFYYFHDRDRDDCIGLDHDIEWYMLSSQDKPWEEVNAWSDLSATLITNQAYPGAILAPNFIYPGLRTTGLKIPEEAIGSRIGFIYRALSKQGIPFVGPTLKVWDLDYYFAQNPTTNPFSDQNQNEGNKTYMIPGPTAGGIVQSSILPPQIESLKITGEFALDRQLRADYLFVSNGSQLAEDQSLFWWGPEGTTEYFATMNPTSGSLDANSPVLTESDLGQVFEVSVLPIKLDNNQLTRGKIVTVTTRDAENEILFAPNLSELTIVTRFTEAEGLVVNDMIYGQYRMQFGTSKEDTSHYEWRSHATNEVIQKGQTLPAIVNAGSQGLTTPLILTSDLIGDYLVLTVFPVDGNQLQGRPLSASSAVIHPLPLIENLTIIYDKTGTNEPPSIGLEVNHLLHGTYQFKSFTQTTDRSIYNWEVGDDELVQSGMTQNGVVPEIQIQPEYVGKTLRLIVTAIDSVNRIGNTLNVTTGSVSQFQPEATLVNIVYLDDPDTLLVDHSIRGEYRFSSVDGASDNSKYLWQVKSTGALLEEGTTQTGNGVGQTPAFLVPLSAAGEIITLTILPIDGEGREGQAQTVESLIVDYRYPVITQIGLVYPKNMPEGVISVGQRLGGFYSINEGENPIDKSEYEWRILGSGIVLDQGQTIKPPADPLGYVPSIVIPGHVVGDIIRLTLKPVDTKGVRGAERTVQTGELQELFPYIEQLAFLRGRNDEVDYRVGQSIGATYRYYSSANSPDNSKYRWSLVSNDEILKEGDTISFATGQGLITAFDIPNAAIGDIVKLTVFPIDGNSLEGPENSIETNQILYQIPQIRNLSVTYIGFDNLIPKGENDVLRASYEFIGIAGATDESTYSWSVYSTGQILAEGTIVIDEVRGLSFIPDLLIEPSFSEQVLELKIQPIDSNKVKGLEQSFITGNTTYVAPQVKDLSVSRMDLHWPHSVLTGRYEFIPGSNSLDKSTFQWISNSTGEVLLEGETIRLNGLRIGAIPNLDVVNSIIGDTIILRIKPIDGQGESGEFQTHSYFIE